LGALLPRHEGQVVIELSHSLVKTGLPVNYDSDSEDSPANPRQLYHLPLFWTKGALRILKSLVQLDLHLLSQLTQRFFTYTRSDIEFPLVLILPLRLQKFGCISNDQPDFYPFPFFLQLRLFSLYGQRIKQLHFGP
jgi:hypothetical protein